MCIYVCVYPLPLRPPSHPLPHPTPLGHHPCYTAGSPSCLFHTWWCIYVSPSNGPLLACLCLLDVSFAHSLHAEMTYWVRRGIQIQTRRVLILLIKTWPSLSEQKLTLLNSNNAPGGNSRLFFHLATAQLTKLWVSKIGSKKWTC